MIKKVIVFLLILMAFGISANAQSEYVVVPKSDTPSYVMDLIYPANRSQTIYTATEDVVKKYGEYFESVTKNEAVDVCEIPDSDPLSPQLFAIYRNSAYEHINADFMKDITTFGNGVKVAVIDSGCNYHIDLKDNLMGGYDYVNGREDFSDTNGHGTHVSGIIAASLDGSFEGIAPKAQIYALKCYDDNKSSTISTFASAIRDAVDYYDCDVISMSMGIASSYTDIYNAVKYAYDNGVIFVASVGNDGNKSNPGKVNYPAGYSEVIGVGSCVNTSDGMKRSTFSQKNSTVMVCAPGESVWSTGFDDRYMIMTGTSQATPMVSAVAALTKSVYPTLTPQKFMEYLSKCSVSINDDYCGYGMIDAKAIFKECIKDRQWYISPITEKGISIYNNSGNTQNVSAFVTGGSSGGIIPYLASIENQQKITINPDNITITKLFLWKSNLKPIIKPIVE